MYQVVNATFKNNSLMLDENLKMLEGKKVKILVFDEDTNKMSTFFDFVSNNKFKIPENYKFNREELNER